MKGFKFDNFFLDAERQQLELDGKTVSLTPKAFGVLTALVESSPETLSKNALMDKVWPDSFVEEGNLKFTINQLRKALGDDSENPKFIETVRGKGYRFIAWVEKVAEKNDTTELVISAENFDGLKTAGNSDKSNRLAWIAVPVIVGTLVIMIAGSALTFRTASKTTVLSRSFNVEKLSNDGETSHAVITKNGESVIYATGMNLDKSSVWVRDLATGNNRVLLPPDDYHYYGLAISYDDKTLYLSRWKDDPFTKCIVKMPISGGVPENVLCADDLQGWIAVSPDNKHLSIVRGKSQNTYFLNIIGTDGQNERTLTTTTSPVRFTASIFTPDGNSIVYAAGQSEDESNSFGIYKIDIGSSEISEFTSERFFVIHDLDWLNNDLVVAASKSDNIEKSALWHISGGEVKDIRSSTDGLRSVSIDRSGERIVSSSVYADFKLDLFSGEGLKNRQELGRASNVTFTPDGRLLFSANTTGKHNIWIMNADGTGRTQLTNDPGTASSPVFVAKSKRIYYASNRTGQTQIWSMAKDGSDAVQVTTENGGHPLFVSPDGAWVYYGEGTRKMLWRLSTDGKAQEKTDIPVSSSAKTTPDGAYTLTFEKERFSLVSVEDRSVAKTYPMPESADVVRSVQWSSDGRSVYMLLRNKISHKSVIWRFAIDGSGSERIVDLGIESLGERGRFDVSPDGKKIAVIHGNFKHDIVLIE